MSPDPDKIKLFHITSYKNLRSIVFEHEALLCKQLMMQDEIKHIDIAYEHIQSYRASISIDKAPYGNLHEYVPFFFCPRPVMLLPISNGKVLQYQEGQNEIIHLVTDYPMVCRLNLSWVHTDGHAIMGLTSFYNTPTDFDKIDWAVVQSKSWGNTPEDNDRKRRKQAEFLAHRSFPWTGVKWIVAINEEVKAQVKSLLQDAEHQPKVLVNKGFYY